MHNNTKLNNFGGVVNGHSERHRYFQQRVKGE